MIGTLIFADIPLATVGGDDAFWGWIDQCPEKDIWNKRPANDGEWSAQVKAEQIWSRRASASSDWQAVGRSSSGWVKQDTNKVDTAKCGVRPKMTTRHRDGKQ